MIRYLAIYLGLTFFGCETMVHMAEVDSSLPAEEGSSRLLLGTTVEAGTDVESTCILTFKSESSNVVIAATLSKRGSPRTFTAPAGTYRFDRLRCEGQRQFELKDILPYRFTVAPGKTALLGSLSMSFDKRKDQVFLRLTDGRKVMNKGFQDAIKRSKQPVLSAYTQKVVTPSMYALGGEGSWNIQLLYDPKAQPKGERPQTPSLDAVFDCEKTEFEWNPLRLGSLQFAIDFENGTEKEWSQSDTVHLFSDAFVNCVKESAKKLTVSSKGKSKIQLSFR